MTKFKKLCALSVLLCLLLSAAPVCAYAAQISSAPDGTQSGTLEVTIESAAILSSQGVIGTPAVSVNGNAVSADLGTLTVPGAYVTIGVTLRNTGTLTAYLTRAVYTLPESDALRVSFPDISPDSGEKLEAGQTCSFTTVIFLDEGYKKPSFDTAGSFMMELYYENDEKPFVPEAQTAGGTSAKTGDSSLQNGGSVSTGSLAAVLWVTLAAVVCALLTLLLYGVLRKRKGSL